MPWIVRKDGGSCGGSKPWAVLNQQTGALVACHATKTKALAQTRALYASEPSASMSSFTAVPYTDKGGMVALYPSPAEAQAIAQPDGQTADDLHVTLCFLPNSADLAQIGPLLADIAEEYEQLTGKMSGVGQFQAGDDGVPIIGLPSVLGMDELRVDIAHALNEAGIEYATNYGWIPHMTLGYDLEDLPVSVLGANLTFDAITFMDTGTRYDYTLRNGNKDTTGPGSSLSNMSEVILMSTGTLAISNTPVTITVTTNGATEEPEVSGNWEGVLAVEGSPSSDKRYLIPSEIGERDLPLPLRVVTSDQGGHDNAVQVGRIESIQHVPIADFAQADAFNLADLPESAIVIWGDGVFDGPANAVELAQTMIRNGAGVSLDLPHDRLALIDPDTFEEVPENEVEMADVLSGRYLTGLAGKIAACTIVDIPAFEAATIRLSDGQAIVASAFGIRMREALVASVGLAPLAPPKAWFEWPEPDKPTPLTVTDDGQVYGHLATWDQCHASFPGSCELAPRSKSGYQFFHLGALQTAEGDTVPVGRITVGKPNAKAGGHNWDLWSGAKGAIEHYDRTGSVAAFVRALDGKHGIWLCGATRSDAPAEAIRDMRANPPSGDWRWEKKGLELVAALSVPVPGFPVPYMMSSAGDHPHVLIATGYTQEERKMATRSDLRKMAKLSALARQALQAMQTCPGCGAEIPAADSICPECGMELMAAKKKQPEMMMYSMPSWMSADEISALAMDHAQAAGWANEIITLAGKLVEHEQQAEAEDAAEGSGDVNLMAILDTLAYTAEERRAMSKNGQALPDGSFPIKTCGDASNAIHAQGRAKNQDETVAHIKKRVKALGCTGSIFDEYK